ncbi:class I SAM-dependent methyltransferase [Candidatus Woesearchaeota archaeon]|jgi:ubiquinone/menaquinone biosynthesis C-methylase UbiE|nr:class I SAM-dependent methyltransferase [Candidatus Woesearchaeota archaeon]MBT4110562.1 class I SAM-dependent methyltransferase [Candidatus Woesearchaeota archaeon]MBT4335914.1 class I SAM-dependent methyltransferase [Candidatus Woesearchaeota archaeon]MBT4469107.1 class I SAM-dependent methyltransferase [Candidatus Woesearchaeota archaeon]MBT6744574.1 class I SAM-dependent methyltransferase [Candidatus Woesearchaeota archaeon]
MVEKEKVKEYWVNSARYDWYKARKKGNLLERLFYGLKIKFILSLTKYKNKRILDLACGTGVNTFDLFKRSGKTMGVDLSSWAIERAKKNFPMIGFKVMDSEKLNFEDNSFDVIVNTGLIQYLDNPQKTIKEMHRILRPGGIVVAEVPWKYSIYNSMFLRRIITGKKNPNDEPINRTYDRKSFIKMFLGFRCLRIRNFLTLVLYGVFRKK